MAVCRQRLIHRLDKATSGVMALAKDVETQRMLSAAFEERRVHKTYLAIVVNGQEIGHVPFKPKGSA